MSWRAGALVVVLLLGVACQAILGIQETASTSGDGGHPADARGDAATAPPDAGAARFSVTPLQPSVDEHEQLEVTIVARDADGHVVTSYHGHPALSADWGDVTVVTDAAFTDGTASWTVSLDRETSPQHPKVMLTALDGVTAGTADIGVSVAAPSWSVVDQTQVFGPGAEGAWDAFVTLPVWLRHDGGYLLFYRGEVANGASETGIGLATSSDGQTWARQGTGPVFTRSESAWDDHPFTAMHVEEDPAGGLVAVYAIESFGVWGVARSTNGGVDWSHGAEGFYPINVPPCMDSFNYPMAVFAESGALHVYFEEFDNPCEVLSSDGGMTFSERTPISGFDNPSSVEVIGVIKEGTVYKMWFRAGDDLAATYATSTDGMSWVVSPSPPITPLFDSVLHNELYNTYEALTPVGQGYGRMRRN